jgi:hypothetical protein
LQFASLGDAFSFASPRHPGCSATRISRMHSHMIVCSRCSVRRRIAIRRQSPEDMSRRRIKKGRIAIGGAVGLVYCFGQIGWAIAELTG